MPTKKPSTSSSMPMEEQDRSIKARKTQLFDDSSHDLAAIAKKPFAEYLKTVPGTALTSGQKAAFWSVGALIALLFVAAVFGGRR